ncbi:MAG: hypothetical protein GY830_09125 [Bacteroidetes bacterium]|nr:hypothetical protein [Bacteroidota bacterium]
MKKRFFNIVENKLKETLKSKYYCDINFTIKVQDGNIACIEERETRKHIYKKNKSQ